jgi:hypothetical protein
MDVHKANQEAEMELLLQEVHVAADWEDNNSESNPFVHRSLENRVYTLLDLTWNFFFIALQFHV